MTTNLLIAVFAAATVGGILNALLGWVQKAPPEPFNPRGFVASVITSIIAAGGIVAAWDWAGVSNALVACVSAFLSGAGIVSGASRISGAITARVASTIARPEEK
jgi:hypothetical protein